MKTEFNLVSGNIFASKIIRSHPGLVPISGPLSLSKSIFKILTICTTFTEHNAQLHYQKTHIDNEQVYFVIVRCYFSEILIKYTRL